MHFTRPATSEGLGERSFALAATPTSMATRNDIHRQMLNTLKRTSTPSQAEKRDALVTCILSGGNTPANPFRESNPDYLLQKQRVEEQKRKAPEEIFKANLERERKEVRKACGDDRPTRYDDAEDIARRLSQMPKLSPVLLRKLGGGGSGTPHQLQTMVGGNIVSKHPNTTVGGGSENNSTNYPTRQGTPELGNLPSPLNINNITNGTVGRTPSAKQGNHPHAAIHDKPFGIYSSGGTSMSTAQNADLSRISTILQRAISPAGYITRPMLRATSAPQTRLTSSSGDHKNAADLSATFEVLAGGDYHSPFDQNNTGGGHNSLAEGINCQDEIAIFELKRAARRRHDAEELERAHALQLQLEMGLNNAMSSARGKNAPNSPKRKVASSPHATPQQKTPLAFTNFSRPGTTYSMSSSFSSQRNFKENLEYAERPPIHPSVLNSVIEQRRAQEAYFGEKVSFGGVDEEVLAEEEERRFASSVERGTNNHDDTEYFDDGVRMDDPMLESNFATNQDGFEVIDVHQNHHAGSDEMGFGDEFDNGRPSSTQSMKSKPMSTARPAHQGPSRPSSTASSAILYGHRTKQETHVQRGKGAGSAASRGGKPPLIPRGVVKKNSLGSAGTQGSARRSSGDFEGSDDDFEEGMSSRHRYSCSNSKLKTEEQDSSDEDEERARTAQYNRRLREAEARKQQMLGATRNRIPNQHQMLPLEGDINTGSKNDDNAGVGFDDEDLVAEFAQQQAQSLGQNPIEMHIANGQEDLHSNKQLRDLLPSTKAAALQNLHTYP